MLLRKGFYRMRNGHTAEVQQQLKIAYNDEYGTPRSMLVWKGRCAQCDEYRTWNLDGSYAAVPSGHSWDIIEKIKKRTIA